MENVQLGLSSELSKKVPKFLQKVPKFNFPKWNPHREQVPLGLLVQQFQYLQVPVEKKGKILVKDH